MQEKTVYALTNPQRSIWLTEQFFNDTTVNNICVSGTVFENVNFDLLKKAINETVRQNDAFRTRILVQNDIPVQYIANFKEFDIDIVTVTNEKDIRLIEENEVKYKFNIIDSDLFKFKLVSFGDNFATIILNAHHIIGDSWSFGLTIQEILRNYHSLVGVKEFEATTSSYIDYIKSEEQYKQSDKFQKDKEYWNSVFKTIPEQATIPSLNSNVQNLSYNAKRLSFNLDKNLVKSITEFCTLNKISVYTFFMSIFAIYVGRVSNLDDFVLGTPILNRTNFKEKHTMGMFVNTVPVRFNIQNNLSFKDLSGNVSKNIMGVLRHQKYSYNSLLDDLRETHKSLPNLYNVVLSYQITKAFSEDFGNYTTNWTFDNYCANDFNIHIFDINDTGSLIVSYDYLIDKYSEKEVSDIQNRMLHIINQILSNPEIECGKIDIVTPEEKDMILNVFNNTAIDYPRDKSIVDLFEEQVEKYPDNVAVSFDGQVLTYKELNKKANSLAHLLKENNITLENSVGLFLDKSIEMIVGVLAILKVGAAYLPIDIEYPISRIKYMLENSNCNVVLTKDSNLPEEILNEYRSIDISLNNDNIYSNNKNNLEIDISSNNLAYIMYTSGSTGTPKGVMVEHRNIVRLVKNTNYIHFKTTDKILQTGSIVFDACTFEIWGALLNGAQLCIIKKEDLLSPLSLKKFIADNHISILWLTAPLFNKLCEDDVTIFDGVNYVLTGGDVLSTKHINKLMKYNKTIHIINGYGPTENTTFSCCFPIDKQYKKSIPIGGPIANSTCYVVSKNGCLQPVGVPGELWVGGDGVSRGYLNRDDLTSKNFLSNPFGENMAYKTGDLVKWSSNGTIDFLGRIDNQVKIRGFRVELNEINLKILNFPYVKESYTTIYTVNNQKHICSYVVFNDSNCKNELKQFLKASLPPYMVPSFIVDLEKLPLNVNGKVDKNELPEPTGDLSEKEFMNARNKLDKELIAILSKMLYANQISLNDTILDLGGDSLTAISFSTKVLSKYGVQLNIKDLLSNYTIKDVSDYISANKLNSNSILKISKVTDQEYYPLSSAQRRIYYNSKMIGEDNLVYNISGAILAEEVLNQEKIKDIFNTIIERHSVLRTNFVLHGNDVIQKIKESIDFEFTVSQNTEDDIQTILKNFAKPFNLENDSLFRVHLHYIDNKKTLMLLETHHIVMDGTGLNNLIIEFNRLYDGANLKKIPIQYKDYAVWENEFLSTELAKQHENYWLNKFRNYEFEQLNLPYDYNYPTVRTYEGAKVKKTLDESYFKQIERYAKKIGVSPYMLFIATFYILLYKYTGQTNITLGTPVANREINETKRMIGMFVNNIVVKGTINSENTFMEFLQTIKEQILNDLSHQSFPFDKLVKELGINLDNSKNPLFDVMFTYQNKQETLVNIGEATCKILEIKNNIAKFDLSFEVCPMSNAINIEYNTSLFKESTIERLFTHYINILDNVLENSNILIKDIEIITPQEKSLISLFNNTSEKITYENVISIFEEQVNLHYNDVAVICDNKSLTYGELNKRANSLAHFLIEKNIKANDIVCIMTNRSLETIVSMLGILKSGAAFLNLDPTYPIDRTNYYIQDSHSEYVLYQEDLKEKITGFSNSIKIDLNNKNIYDYCDFNPCIKTNPNDLSYIIYTSGSTGTPKGVMLNQIGLANMALAMTKSLDYLRDGKKHTLLSVTSTPFDIFVYEIIVSLTHGMKIVMANNSEHRNPILLEKLILNHNVDVMTVTPSLMKINYDNRSNNIALANVKNMVFGGEPLPQKFVDDLRSLADDITIYNIYGPSEITILSNVQNLNDQKEITVGPPIMNTQIYIVDQDMNQLPIGVVGEICIAGIQVGLGYIGKDELTSEKFLSNPFGPGKIYKSGDIGRWTFDGKVQCLGRIDHQIKLRGLRIELGEIENKILQIPGVSSAIVNKVEQNGNESLCAYYVSDKDIFISEVREFLSNSLPRHMIPKYIIRLDKIPYTINRKIDRKALPLPDYNQSINNSKVDISTLKSDEEKLLQIWKNTLNVDNINIDDNFFELGGDSISAISVQLEAVKYNLSFEYADIFNYPTIRTLAKKVPILDKDFIKNYNYNNINSLLSHNTDDYLKTISKFDFNNILLIGSTGYLGAHIIDSFMKNQKGSIYCLIRIKNNELPEERLMNTLKFYFGNKYINEIGNRIKIVTGDITEEFLGLSVIDYNKLRDNIDIVINSGALVKHYGLKQKFENININGTKNVVAFCKNTQKRLVHISTMSVSGFGEKENSCFDSNSNKIDFSEKDIYVGQTIKGIYTSTKYKAELIVLEAISNGLNAQILRIGNITNRYSDGVFQKNIENNAFASRIKSFIDIGAFPQYALNHKIEFTPVDLCADCIVKILNYTSSCNVFHIYNPNLVSIKLFYDILNKNFNSNIIPLSNTKLSYMINGILNDPSTKDILSGIIYDLDNNKNLIYTSNISIKSNFTTHFLNYINFTWKEIDTEYLNKYIKYFEKIQFFNFNKE